MEARTGSTTDETSQQSRLGTNPTSLSSGLPITYEDLIDKAPCSVSSAGTTAVSDTICADVHLAGIGTQFEGDDIDATLPQLPPAFIATARGSARGRCKPCCTAATGVERHDAIEQAGLRRRRSNNDIDLRLLEEGQAHLADTVGTSQRPSVIKRVCLYAFASLAVLTLGLMAFGLTWATADHHAARKGVLFGGLVALTLFIGGAMTAGGCSVIEVFAMASLLVASGSLVQGLWIAAANQV